MFKVSKISLLISLTALLRGNPASLKTSLCNVDILLTCLGSSYNLSAILYLGVFLLIFWFIADQCIVDSIIASITSSGIVPSCNDSNNCGFDSAITPPSCNFSLIVSKLGNTLVTSDFLNITNIFATVSIYNAFSLALLFGSIPKAINFSVIVFCVNVVLSFSEKKLVLVGSLILNKSLTLSKFSLVFAKGKKSLVNLFKTLLSMPSSCLIFSIFFILCFCIFSKVLNSLLLFSSLYSKSAIVFLSVGKAFKIWEFFNSSNCSCCFSISILRFLILTEALFSFSSNSSLVGAITSSLGLTVSVLGFIISSACTGSSSTASSNSALFKSLSLPFGAAWASILSSIALVALSASATVFLNSMLAIMPRMYCSNSLRYSTSFLT